jgi:hypothetical protein
MIFNLEDKYVVDVKFNACDIVIQLEYKDKIYQDVFLFNTIKSENNFFSDMSIIEKFIIKCLNDKDDKFNYEIKINKVANINIKYESELSEIELEFCLLPIRKDISTNAQIIELKKKVLYLENKLERFKYFDSFYFHSNLSELINFNNTVNMSFTDEYLDSHYCKGFGRKLVINNSYYEKREFSYLLHRYDEGRLGAPSLSKSYDLYTLFDRSKVKNINILDRTKSFMTEDFKKLKTKNMMFMNCKNNINLENLPLTTEILLFLNCDIINFDKIKIFPKKIYLLDCRINNINKLKKADSEIFVNIVKDTKIEDFDKSCFPANVEII